MNKDLEIFNFFVEDLLASETDLLEYELDILLMQYIFQSIDLKLLKNIYTNEEIVLAS